MCACVIYTYGPPITILSHIIILDIHDLMVLSYLPSSVYTFLLNVYIPLCFIVVMFMPLK